VNTGEISDFLSDEQIRQTIRDEYLKDSAVTIVLVGQETKRRKHVDWEIYSSMYNGKINKKSGILVINLPGTTEIGIVTKQQEKDIIYPDVQCWEPISSRKQLESQFPHMPERIIDNLLRKTSVRISVVSWSRIANHPQRLQFLIKKAIQDRHHCHYDLSQPLCRKNSLSPLHQLLNLPQETFRIQNLLHNLTK